jgi:small multidrug resistance pump
VRTRGLIYLLLAILFEVAGTTSLKLSDGFSRLVPSLLVAVCYGISFLVFARALKQIEVSTGYAIWSGLGTALVAIIGVVVFKESMTSLKLLALALRGCLMNRYGGMIHRNGA